jgi:hypothetical protein
MMEALSSVVKVTRPREVAGRSLHESFNIESVFFKLRYYSRICKKYVWYCQELLQLNYPNLRVFDKDYLKL